MDETGSFPEYIRKMVSQDEQPQTEEEMMRKKRHQWQLEKVAEIKKDYQ